MQLRELVDESVQAVAWHLTSSQVSHPASQEGKLGMDGGKDKMEPVRTNSNSQNNETSWGQSTRRGTHRGSCI